MLIFVKYDDMGCLQMWEDLVIKAKNAGLDVIDTYVFWNIHEPTQGNVSLLDLLLHFYSFAFLDRSRGPF